jgi:protoheme IX farnesyltransferase
MPHFYAIAIYRLKDYAAASIPVWSEVKGVRATKVQILIYTIGFIVSSGLLTAFGYTGRVYLVMVTIIGLIWLAVSVQGLRIIEANRWARKMFGYSLLVLLVMCALISVEGFWPI